MKNVLIFPCGSEIGLEIYRSLHNSKHFSIFGGNSVDDHGKFVYKNYISGLPFVSDENFVQVINSICEDYNIDFIIPAHDSVVLTLAENQDKIKAVVITSPYETCKICRSKKSTYEKFDKVISTPKVYEATDPLNFPIFLKPDIGQGSKGTFKATSVEDIFYHTKKDPTLLWLEYLPGKEYTIDCFTNKHGELLFCEGRTRSRITNGISVNSFWEQNPKFKEIASKINNSLKFRGMWFFQLKERKDGELVLMEISPRVAGTMGLFRIMGVNFSELSLFDRMDYNIEIILNNIGVILDKAMALKYSFDIIYDTIYIDFDDTIIVNNVVNADAIKLIYQAKNNGRKAVLITKHKYDINKSLERFSIPASLFSEIIVLKPDQDKADFINPLASIFIDDSFQERKSVYNKLKIPTFGVDCIEALIG